MNMKHFSSYLNRMCTRFKTNMTEHMMVFDEVELRNDEIIFCPCEEAYYPTFKTEIYWTCKCDPMSHMSDFKLVEHYKAKHAGTEPASF